VDRNLSSSRFSRHARVLDRNSARPGAPGFVIMLVLRAKTKSTRSGTNRKAKHLAISPVTSPTISEGAPAHAHADLFAHGVTLFNTRYFFEAHEAWEEIWLHTPPPEKTFLQGLIQVTAAFHHHSRENFRGTKSLLRAGLEKLDAFPAKHRGLQIDQLRAAVRRWLTVLDQENITHWPALPRIAPTARSR
jgi:uncharacterized protein